MKVLKRGGQIWLRVSIEKEGRVLAGTEEIATISPIEEPPIGELPIKIIYKPKVNYSEEFSLEVESPEIFNSINSYSNNSTGFEKAIKELEKINISNSSSVIQYSRNILNSLKLPLVNVPVFLKYLGREDILDQPAVQDEINFLFKIDKSDMASGLFGDGLNVDLINKLWDSIELKNAMLPRAYRSIWEDSLLDNIRSIKNILSELKIVSLKSLMTIFLLLIFFQMMTVSDWNLKFISGIFPELLPSGIYASVIWQSVTLLLVAILTVYPGAISFRLGIRINHFLKRFKRPTRIIALFAGISMVAILGFLIYYFTVTFAGSQGLMEIGKSNSIENVIASIFFALSSLLVGLSSGYLSEGGKKSFERSIGWRKLMTSSVLVLAFCLIVVVAVSTKPWVNCGYKYNLSSGDLNVYEYVRLTGWQESSKIAIFESNNNKWYSDDRWINPPVSLVVSNKEIESLDSCNNVVGSVSNTESLILARNGRFLYVVDVLPPEIYSTRRLHIVSTSFGVLDRKSDQYWIKKIYY